jgi:hypothetical protein
VHQAFLFLWVLNKFGDGARIAPKEVMRKSGTEFSRLGVTPERGGREDINPSGGAARREAGNTGFADSSPASRARLALSTAL